MRTESRAVDKIFKRRDRYEIPDWQRAEVWSKKRKQDLIDSILLGWRLPKFYFVRTSDTPEAYEVVDGQQRLSAIFEFLDNELALTPSSAKTHGGKLYSELPDTASDQFDDFEIQFDEITDADDKDLKLFFQRLQQGLPLTASERLNSIESKLRDFCKSSSSHKFFVENISVSNRRYAHFDISSKVAAIEVEGMGVGLRFEDVKEVFEAQASFSKSSQVAKRISAALSLLQRSFGKNEAIFRNRATTQSFITLACRIVEADATIKKSTSLAEFGHDFGRRLAEQIELGHKATESDLTEYQRTVNANVKTGAKTRHTILLRRLIQFDPSFFAIASGAVAPKILFANVIESKAEETGALVVKINDAYSSKHGPNLFKPTNKTTSALQRSRKPCGDYEDWKQFIEDMYFLLWEGPGSKLKGHEPASFNDVNDLRTALQHDVDHGKAGKVSKKNIALGNVFKTYAGFTSASVVAPEVFPVAQAKLLATITEDLSDLLATFA